MDDKDRDQLIRERAYRIWEDEGQEHGQHDDHWHRAAAEHDAAGEAAPDAKPGPGATTGSDPLKTATSAPSDARNTGVP